MSLFEINYTSEQQKMLDNLEEIGVVAETVIMSAIEPIKDVYSCSKAAAIKGMELLARRHIQRWQKFNPQSNIEEYFQVRIFPNEDLIGNEITLIDFIGKGYELQSGTIKLFSYHADKQTISHDIMDGFAYALLNPPYGLRLHGNSNPVTEEHGTTKEESLNKIIVDYLRILLYIVDNQNRAHLRFFSWSDNWSDYFDAGKEWWGTFCWTIYNSQNGTITLIAASSTD